MTHSAVGKVTLVSKLLWFKVNTKCIRTSSFDGAIFPHIIKVDYIVNSLPYTKRKWISAGLKVPSLGDAVKVIYDDAKPKKARIII